MTLEDDHPTTATGQVVGMSQSEDSRTHDRIIVLFGLDSSRVPRSTPFSRGSSERSRRSDWAYEARRASE